MSVLYGECRVNPAGEVSLEYTLLVCLDRTEELPAIHQSPALKRPQERQWNDRMQLEQREGAV